MISSNSLKITLTTLTLGPVLALFGSTALQADVTRYSLEELLGMEITSVAKKPQRLSHAAAAVHVITSEDIRRSGLSSVPELLRMVPGLHVARIDAGKWAISSRGFNGIRANKLLVLMDGRTLYTPLFSGVYWDVQDTPLEDIERIEVIRGPGGALWGANAVNGVINIITRHSRETQGTLISARAGGEEKAATLRQGGALGEDGWLRAYAKTKALDNFEDNGPTAAHDAWDIQQAGFRGDWRLNPRDALTVQGDIYQGKADQTIGSLADLHSATEFLPDTADLRGGNLLMRWQRKLSSDSEWELQTYFDHTERRENILEQRIDTFDVDFHHRFALSESQEITWGLGYRFIQDDIDNSFTVSFTPDRRDQHLYSAFIQDEISLRRDLMLTLGSKFEHNDFTGFEVQPNARLLWQASQAHSLWGAVSRAVHTPSRSDLDIRINVAAFSSPFVDPDGPGPLPPGTPTLLSIFGNPDLDSEEVIAFELGWRGSLRQDLSVDLAGFYNLYDRLYDTQRELRYETSPPPSHMLIASNISSRMEGNSYGLELSANWQPIPQWRLTAGYAWQQLDMRTDPAGADPVKVREREAGNPQQQLQLRSLWNIRHDLELDLALYYVDAIDAISPGAFVPIPAYTRLDLRLGWHPTKDLQLSIGGQNLLDDKHPEFVTRDVVASSVPRTFYGQAILRF